MATRTQTTDANSQLADGVLRTWAGLLNGDNGDAGGSYITASFQVSGTFGAGGSVSLQGSNDGANWYALSPTALTAAGGFGTLGVAEHPRYIRPIVTAGDGTTNLTVVGFFANPRRAF